MDHQPPDSISAGLTARGLALWEIVSVLVSGLIGEWFVVAFLGRSRWYVLIPIFLALGLMMYSHLAYRENPRQLGFRFDNFLAAARLLFLPTAAAVLTVLLVGWFMTNSIALKPLRARFLVVPLWALFQQYALQGYINRRAQIVLGPGLPSVSLVAVVFAVLHLPNPVLSVLTLLGGFMWAALYQREQNLFALAVSHSIASIAVTLSFPAEFVNSLRVGLKFFG
jgi:Type II CAAX prenyl endopeptidase Rce1-like